MWPAPGTVASRARGRAAIPRRSVTGPDVVHTFQNAFDHWGIPASVLTDNGAVFTGLPRRGGRVALEVQLGRLGVRFDHSRPHHPQTCGKVERFQQTEKKWLAAQEPATSLAELHRQLARFRGYYNKVRPHRALHHRTPWQAYTARPKATATGPYIDPHWRVRHDKIDKAGTVTLRHDSRLHHIGVGRRYAGTRILVLAHDLDIRVLTTDGELIRELVLDPSRDYQPQPKT